MAKKTKSRKEMIISAISDSRTSGSTAKKKNKAAKPQKRVTKKPTSTKPKTPAATLPKPIDVMSRRLDKPDANSALGKAIAEKMSGGMAKKQGATLGGSLSTGKKKK